MAERDARSDRIHAMAIVRRLAATRLELRVTAFAALASAIVVLSACGARAEEQPRDMQAERIAQLSEQRDALAQRVDELERRLATPVVSPVTTPRDHVRPIVVRRWLEQLTTDGHVLTLRLCIRSFELDQVFGGQAFFYTSDLCGNLEADGRAGDPAMIVPALLADEEFACWMLAAPERAIPDCFRTFAAQRPDPAPGS